MLNLELLNFAVKMTFSVGFVEHTVSKLSDWLGLHLVMTLWKLSYAKLFTFTTRI